MARAMFDSYSDTVSTINVEKVVNEPMTPVPIAAKSSGDNFRLMADWFNRKLNNKQPIKFAVSVPKGNPFSAGM